jgi:hypothetical protein
MSGAHRRFGRIASDDNQFHAFAEVIGQRLHVKCLRNKNSAAGAT